MSRQSFYTKVINWRILGWKDLLGGIVPIQPTILRPLHVSSYATLLRPGLIS